jgi:hypothetical protein
MSILLLQEGAAAAASGPQPVQSGLLALYQMGEGSGQSLPDSSGAGRDGTLGSTAGADTNDPLWTAAGLSYSTDDYADCGASSALQPAAWTVCVAAKLTPDVVNPMLGWHGASQLPSVYAAAPFNQQRPLIWLATNCFRYFEKSNPVNLHDGGWHFLVFTCPGNAAADILSSALVVDGQAQAVSSTTNTQDGAAKTTCRIGAAGTTYFASAETAFFALYDRVLSGGEQEQMRTYATAVLDGRVTLP